MDPSTLFRVAPTFPIDAEVLGEAGKEAGAGAEFFHHQRGKFGPGQLPVMLSDQMEEFVGVDPGAGCFGHDANQIAAGGAKSRIKD